MLDKDEDSINEIPKKYYIYIKILVNLLKNSINTIIEDDFIKVYKKIKENSLEELNTIQLMIRSDLRYIINK